jgi:hypothetical protein
MIVWAIGICAVVGFVLGLQFRLLLLAAASALVAACLPLVLRDTESELVSSSLTILVLLVVLQAFFLAGGVVRVSGRRVPLPSTGASLSGPRASRGSGS